MKELPPFHNAKPGDRVLLRTGAFEENLTLETIAKISRGSITLVGYETLRFSLYGNARSGGFHPPSITRPTPEMIATYERQRDRALVAGIARKIRDHFMDRNSATTPEEIAVLRAVRDRIFPEYLANVRRVAQLEALREVAECFDTDDTTGRRRTRAKVQKMIEALGVEPKEIDR